MANCRQCGTPLPSASFGELPQYCANCAPQQPPRRKERLEDVVPQIAPGHRWLTGTNLLVAINCVVFLVMVLSGVNWFNPTSEELLPWGADFGPKTLAGEYWRLITSAFVHIGVIHLLLNMWCLVSLGKLVEKLFGRLATIAIYVLTAVGADLLSLSWNPMRVTAGASGAIFGLAGILVPVLYYGKLDVPQEKIRKLLGYVVRFCLYNLLYGLKGGIDNMAHLGGLVTGLLAGIFLAQTFSSTAEERSSRQRNILLGASLVVLVLILPIRKMKSYAIESYQGQQAVERKDYKTAIEHLQRYVAAQPHDAWGHGALGYALQEAHRNDDAIREYQRALALEPGTAWVELALANLYFLQDQNTQAVELYRKSIGPAKGEADDYRSYGAALSNTKNYKEAEQVLLSSLKMNDKDPLTHKLLADVYVQLHKPQDASKERARATELEPAK